MFRHSAAVDLPSRAFDILVYLIEHRDRSVDKEEIIAAIWGRIVVTDDSLIHAVSVLRRVLGDERQHSRYIQTVPRRGYRFVAELLSDDGPQASAAPSGDATAQLPASPASRDGQDIVHPGGRTIALLGATPGTAVIAGLALLIAVAVLLPVAWAAVWVGHRVHVRLASATVARAVGAMLFISGAALILRTL